MSPALAVGVRRAGLIASLIAVAACGHNAAPTDAPAGGGVINVQIVQAGLVINRSLPILLDGTIKDTSRLGPAGNWTRLFVPTGEHVIELTGLAANCSAINGSRKVVSVGRQDPVDVKFDVRCTADELLAGREAAYLTAGEWENSQLWFLSKDGVPRKAGVDAGDFSWAPDGDRLAIQNWGAVSVISRTGGTAVRDLFPGTEVANLAWAPDGASIAAVNSTAPCRLNLAAGAAWEKRSTFGCGDLLPSELSWSPVSDELALAVHFQGEIRISLISARSGALTPLAAIRPSAGLNGLAWSPDGSKLAAGLLRGDHLVVMIYDRLTGAWTELLAEEGGTWYGGTLQWLGDGSALLVGPVIESRTFVGFPGSSGLVPCHVVAVVPLTAPDTWRPLLPCGEMLRLSISRRPR